MGVAQYHLYNLEKEKKILSRRRGLYKLFYGGLIFGENQEAILEILSRETDRDLLLYIMENPGTNQTLISQYARISASSVNWHMKRMVNSGLIIMKREGQFVRYDIAADRDEILRLVRSYHPSLWDKWADRLSNALNEISLAGANEEKADSQEQSTSKREQEGRTTT